MTIAAGFPYRDGILLCADTQQEGSASKSFSPKIGLFECPGGKIGFAYSGNTNFSIAAAQKCAAKLRGITDPNDIVPELEKAYRSRLNTNSREQAIRPRSSGLGSSRCVRVWFRWPLRFEHNVAGPEQLLEEGLVKDAHRTTGRIDPEIKHLLYGFEQ